MWHRIIQNLSSTSKESIGEVEMDTTQSDDVLEMASLINNSSERCFQTNQIWKELFPESKTMLISDLKKLIDKIGKVSHTTYTRNNMGQKCEGNCGLWVLNEII